MLPDKKPWPVPQCPAIVRIIAFIVETHIKYGELSMLKVETTQETITLSFDKDFLSPVGLSNLIENLRMKELLSKSQLTEQQAFILSEELKDNWWKNNRNKILEKIK